jgi:hypothetical protein
MAKPDKAKEIRELRALVPENNLCLNCLSKVRIGGRLGSSSFATNAKKWL